MVEAIESFFLNILGRELCVFVCSMIPIIELRGGIPLAAGLGLPWYVAFPLAVIGNLLPVPFLLLFTNAMIIWMKKVKGLCKIANWLEAKAEKNRAKVEKYAFWGLCLFVAIPLPGTGAWTGCLVASVTRIKFSKATLSVIVGVLVAGVIMTLISYGVFGFLSFLI